MTPIRFHRLSRFVGGSNFPPDAPLQKLANALWTTSSESANLSARFPNVERASPNNLGKYRFHNSATACSSPWRSCSYKPVTDPSAEGEVSGGGTTAFSLAGICAVRANFADVCSWRFNHLNDC